MSAAQDPRLELAARVAAVDGVSPLNEASRIAIAEASAARVDERLVEHGTLVAAAYAAGDAPIELFVDPEHRRAGHGRALLRRTAAAAADQTHAAGDATHPAAATYWAHGDLPPAQALARAEGLTVARTLLVLERGTADPLPAQRDVDGVTIRTWRDEDEDGLLAVNARAFASHPEQGAMDHADLRARMAQPWFDPAGLFVAERDGNVIGFHWTKVDPPVASGGTVGEVYVVGVDPSAQGLGLGRALTLRGLHHLADLGLERIDLYVEGDNDPALATYRGLGFTESARDVLYVGDAPVDGRLDG